MKKRVVLSAGVFIALLVLLLSRCQKSPKTADPFALLQKPFTCTVNADIRGFVFSFDVHGCQGNLQLTITAPDSLAGIGGTLSADTFTLYKGDIALKGGSGGVASLVKSLFAHSDTKIRTTKQHIIAEGTDENGDFEIVFDRQSLFPIAFSGKDTSITAQIVNFVPSDD